MPENGQNEKKRGWHPLRMGKALHRKLNDVVAADRPPNNIVLICKNYYIDCWKIKVGLDSSQGYPTYTATTLSKEETVDNHMSVLSSFWSFHERWGLGVP
jgi:hypothetical protein